MTTFDVKDSGERVEWNTGSVRDTQDGKPRYDLIGIHGLKRLAEHMAKGALKYGERNWEKGQPTSRSYASALRHLMQWAMGDSDEDHLAAVAFNVFSIMHVEEGGNNAELFGKAGLMDHPRYPNSASYREDRIIHKIVLNVVVTYQVRRGFFGGTLSQLHDYWAMGDTSNRVITTQEFSEALIWLRDNQYIHCEEDGYHDALWQAAFMGAPEWWATDKNLVPQKSKTELGTFKIVSSREVVDALKNLTGDKTYPYTDEEGFKHLDPYTYIDKNGQAHNHCYTCGKCITCKSCSCKPHEDDGDIDNDAEPYEYQL